MRARHVFISYSRTDHEYLERLSDQLQESGLAVWTDWGIEPGTSRWTIAIRDHIDTCAAFVVVMTPEAEKSEWVGREIRRAQTKDKPILPLLLGGDAFFVINEHQIEDVSDRRMPSDRFIRRLAHLTSVADLPPLDSATATSTDWRDEGSRLFSLGRWVEALAAYDRTIALDPNDAEAYYQRARSLARLDRWEEMLEASDRAIELAPDQAKAHANRGWVLATMGRYEEALAAQDCAIALDYTDPNAHTYRGRVLAELDRLEEAMAAFDRAVAIDQTDPVPHSHRGWVLAQMGRSEEARVANDRARSIHSTSR